MRYGCFRYGVVDKEGYSAGRLVGYCRWREGASWVGQPSVVGDWREGVSDEDASFLQSEYVGV